MNTQPFVYLDAWELAVVKDQLRERDSDVAAAVQALALEADQILSLAPSSVMEKTGVAASGDPHDFYAIGGYSWPNPGTPDRLPYLYRDSETNPEALESGEFDKGRYEEMTRRVAVLALAYHYTDDPRYAAHAAANLRRWFIDPATRMNPNFRYAAARPGVWDGHFSGTIEGVFLIEMLDFVGLLEGSAAWEDSDDSALRAWFHELSDWLVSSRFGRREIYSLNNHGSYLLAQVAAFSAYGGNHKRASKAIRLARREVSRQFLPDGRMPLEIDRADGWFYSVYGLRAFAVLARLGERYGTNLWQADGGVIARSCAALAPYLAGKVAWPYSRGNKPWEHDAVQTFHMASRAYASGELRDAAQKIAAHSQEPLVSVALLGLHVSAEHSANSTLPVTQRWPDAIETNQSLTSRLEITTARILGVLASRGIWPARRLR